MAAHKAYIEQVVWHQVRDQVAKLHPKLAAVIDPLDPGSDFPLYLAHYPFGSSIVNYGVHQLPTPDGLVAPHSAQPNDKIRANLQRRTVPISLILNNATEVYFEMPDRIVSLNYFRPGFIFGIWENLDPTQSYFVKHIWSVSAGARSLFMLPKITDASSHKELRKKYNVRSHLPKTMLDHWRIFTEIANSPQFETEWFTTVLMFSDKWMDTITTDPAWRDCYNFILQDGWNQSQYWRNKVSFDIIWEVFINKLTSHNIKPNPYFVDIVKHLVLVGTGVLPGSTAADDRDEAGPIRAIQDVYINDYKLKDYVPTILQPYHFDLADDIPVYYSLQQPSLLGTTPVSRRLPSILRIMPEISFLMDSFQLEVLQGEIKTDDTPISTFANEVAFELFHSEAEPNSNIHSTIEMAEQDPRLMALPPGNEERLFAESGQFVRGCIRMAAKNSQNQNHNS